MTITVSDADFLQWLKRGAPNLTILAEPRIVYQRSGAPAEDILYLSDRPFKSKLSDTVPSRQYRDWIKSAPTFARGIDATQLGGRGVSEVGSLDFNNADGAVDGLLNSIIDGHEVPFYIGDFDWGRDDFRLVNVAVMLTFRCNDDKSASISLKDRGLLLDTSIIGTTIPSGPNAGKPRPVLFGQVLNLDLTPYLLDEANLIYGINSYAMYDFTRVLDLRTAGISLLGTPFLVDNTQMTADAATNIITKNGHGLVVDDVIYFSGNIFDGLESLTQYWIIAANLTTNTFQVSRTRGGTAEDITGTTFSDVTTIYKRRFLVDIGAATAQLSSKPSQLTADIRSTGPSGNALLQGIPHIGFQYILDNYTSLVAADRDQASFDALVAEEIDDQIQWGTAVLDRANVMDILDLIATLTNSWYSWTYEGKLKVGKFDLQNLDSVTPIDTITDVVGEPMCENLEIRFGKIILDSNRNVVVQSSGLAAGVSAFDASRWSQNFQLRVKTTDNGLTDYDSSYWRYHKTAVDSEPMETALFAQATGAQHLCDERTLLFKPFVRRFSCVVGLEKYQLNPGDPVKVFYPRYGLSGGQMFRVLSINVRLSDREIDLVLVRHAAADFLRSSSFTKPNPPTGVTAEGGNGQATITWVPPDLDGGSSITEYLITSLPGGIQARGLPLLVNGVMAMVMSGLTNLTSYTFTVVATNSIGTSDPSAASNAITPDTQKFPPQPPIIGAPTRGNAQVSVAFTPPTDDGGRPITLYEVLSTPGSFMASGAGSPIVVTGLVNGTNYTFKVRAKNVIGYSPYSGDSVVAKPATVPNAPSRPSISPGNGAVTVSWLTPPSGGEPITQYTVRVFRVSDNVQVGSGTSANLTKSVTGLTNGVAVYATVEATNLIGTGAASSNSVAVTPDAVLNPPDAPTAPSGARGDTQVTVSWSAPFNGGSTILDYTVSTYNGSTLVRSDTTTGLSVVVTGLVNGQSYTFKVKARNAVGSSADSPASAAVVPARAPNLSSLAYVTAVAGNAQATVSIPGGMDTGGDAVSQIRVTSTPGNITADFANPATVSVLGGSVVVPGLTNGIQYTFKVTATNSVGTSAPSAASNSVTPVVPSHQVAAPDIYNNALSPNPAVGSSKATVTGGVGPFTFSWAFVAGGTGISLINNTLSTVTARTNTGSVQVKQGTLRVTVVDTGNANQTVTKDINVYLEVSSSN
jgi:hypothetical protein